MSVLWEEFVKAWTNFQNFIEILTFKTNINKILGKFDESLNFLLLSILIAGWGVSCSPSFANFPGFRGEGSFPLPPGNIYFLWVYSVLNFINWNQIWLYIPEIFIEISILI